MAMKPVKTLGEFVRLYDKDLERILCKSFKKYINVDELEDIKSEVYEHLLDKKFFETYDPTKAQFSTFLYTYLRYFLKSRKGRLDKELVRKAESLNAPVFDDSNVTLLDIKDFSKALSTTDHLEIRELEEQIHELMKARLKNIVPVNPYPVRSVENFFWDFMQVPRTIKEIENFVQLNSDLLTKNPYSEKKDNIKFRIFDHFSNSKFCVITDENCMWGNVAGVSKADDKQIPSRYVDLYKFICENSPTNNEMRAHKFRRKLSGIAYLMDYGLIVREKNSGKRRKPLTYRKNASVFHFDLNKNLTWSLINKIKDDYPELLVFDNNTYSINVKENLAYKIYKMIVNGNTNKKIANTFKIKSSVLSSTKKFVLNDIKKLITT